MTNFKNIKTPGNGPFSSKAYAHVLYVCTGRLIQPITNMTNDNTRTNIKGLLELLASFVDSGYPSPILCQYYQTQTYPGK